MATGELSHGGSEQPRGHTQVPAVSVIVIVRNGEKHIAGQLAALGAQVGAPDFEVIVADNGSTDGTAAIVEAWIAAVPAAPQQVRLVDASARAGIPFARNTGALASTGRILAFCDADDAVDEGWVAAVARAVPEGGMIGGSTRAVDVHGHERPDLNVTGLVETHSLPYAPGCNFAVSRECFFTVGGFDESLPPYGFDDVEFSWRVQKHGRALIHAPGAVVSFLVTGNAASARKVFLLGKGRMVMIARHPEFAVLTYTLGSCLKEVVSGAVLLPWRMIRPRGGRAREVRWLLSAAGRLAGYWHVHVLNRDAGPLLIPAQPEAADGRAGD